MSAPIHLEARTSRRRATLRTGLELLVSLVVLVLLFRAFLAGGYLIETGSMAPCLLGFHFRVRCPECRYEFMVEGSLGPARATCPNCGKAGIDLDGLPRNDGDHLMVHRGAFDYREPRRWEVVLFQNPNRPTQALVKRLIGLPGEHVEIRQGDIYVNNTLVTKPYATQRGMRIPVYDHDYRPDPDDPDWQTRWVAEEPQGGWSDDGGTLRFVPVEGSSIAWMNYRHWIRRGGTHKTSVPIDAWPDALPEPRAGFGPLMYDKENKILVCRGALPRDLRDQLFRAGDRRAFRQAIERLYEASHIAPITDTYGYNRIPGGGGREEVRDLMVEARVTLRDRKGLFVLSISDGTETLECRFDADNRRAQLVDTRTGKVVRTSGLPDALVDRTARVEMSLMDRQALVAVEGELVFEPWSYPAAIERGPTPWRPVRLGAGGGRIDVEALKLFRDVHYTAIDGPRTTSRSWTLGRDEYFVLGDNSPVSRDSRGWSERAAFRRDLFLGKPLFVHLPSRKARFRIAGWQTEIRIPELSRIRYIH